jgi:hypothetical protein
MYMSIRPPDPKGIDTHQLSAVCRPGDWLGGDLELETLPGN